MSKRSYVAVLGWIGLLPLFVVWWAQHVEGLVPCQLCLWERWPYDVLAAVGLFGSLLLGERQASLVASSGLACGLAACALSLLHMGVERGWWPDPVSACRAAMFHGGTFAERLASMPLRPAKPCDAPSYVLGWLPVSMSAMDFVYALCVVLLSAWFIVRIRRMDALSI